MENDIDKSKMQKYNNVNAKKAISSSNGEELHFIQTYETVEVYKYSSNLIRAGVVFVSQLNKLYKFSIGQKLIEIFYNNMNSVIQAYTHQNLFTKLYYINNSISLCELALSLFRALELSNAIINKDQLFIIYDTIIKIKMQNINWYNSVNNKIINMGEHDAKNMYYQYNHPFWPFTTN